MIGFYSNDLAIIWHDGSANVEPNLTHFSLVRKSTVNYDIKSAQELQIEYFSWITQGISALEMTDAISLRSYNYILQQLRKNQSHKTFEVTSFLRIASL